MRKSKLIQERRDRRKAKQSDFRRPGRGNPKKIGHGGSGETQQTQEQPNNENIKVKVKKTKKNDRNVMKTSSGQPLAKAMTEAGISFKTIVKREKRLPEDTNQQEDLGEIMPDIGPGKIIRFQKFTNETTTDGGVTIGAKMKASKGRIFVALLLGTEPLPLENPEKDQINVDDFLINLGWTPTPDHPGTRDCDNKGSS